MIYNERSNQYEPEECFFCCFADECKAGLRPHCDNYIENEDRVLIDWNEE